MSWEEMSTSKTVCPCGKGYITPVTDLPNLIVCLVTQHHTNLHTLIFNLADRCPDTITAIPLLLSVPCVYD